MRISESLETFQRFLAARGKALETMLPRDVLVLGFEFYETVRATDALPLTEEDFGDALLFEWGTREALLPHYGACFYFDLTRQFISVAGEDDDAMFQLHFQLQYPVSDALRSLGSAHRWCGSFEALLEFKTFCLSHPSHATLEGLAPEHVDLTFSGV
jgi:hypothetical protein